MRTAVDPLRPDASGSFEARKNANFPVNENVYIVLIRKLEA